MKISKDLKKITTTQSAFGKVIGKTAARVNQMIQEGTVVLDESTDSGGVLLIESLKNYYLLQKNNAPSNNASDTSVNADIDYNYEHARLEKLKADREEIRVNKLKGELYEAKQVEYTIVGMYTVLRNQLQGLPSQICSELPENVRGDVFRIMSEKIDNYLSELSSIDVDDFVGGDVDGEL